MIQLKYEYTIIQCQLVRNTEPEPRFLLNFYAHCLLLSRQYFLAKETKRTSLLHASWSLAWCSPTTRPKKTTKKNTQPCQYSAKCIILLLLHFNTEPPVCQSSQPAQTVCELTNPKNIFLLSNFSDLNVCVSHLGGIKQQLTAALIPQWSISA